MGKGKRLPHSYVFVRDAGLSMYASVEDISLGQEKRPLEKGMSLVVARTIDVDGVDYIQTKDGDFVKKSGVRWGGQGSDWSGVVIVGEHEAGPSFGWISHDKTPVLDAPDRGAARVDKLEKRQRVALHESKSVGGRRWVRIGPERWVEADKVNEVEFIEPPRGVVPTERLERTDNDQWIDVNVGEQVLVAYRGRTPVYATLVSTGRGHKTPLGNYPIWAKVASTDMANQPYEDNPYLVQGVPWVLFFQGDNALHGAYWHNSFGRKKSHGCVNLAPMDARWIFEWVTPTLPAGWTGYLPVKLRQDGVVVHVRDTSLGPGLEFIPAPRL